MNVRIPVENGDVLAAVRGFLRRLLEAQVVQALYVPLEAGGGAIVPALVTDAARLAQANPLAPVMPINGARAVSALTGKHSPARLGVVLRSCELRALVELVKLQQASLENVVLIGLDCAGTYEVADYAALQGEGRFHLADHLAAAARGETPPAARPACRMCTQPIPESVDIHLQLIGVDAAQGLSVSLRDDLAAQMQLGGSAPSGADGAAVVERLIADRARVRETELAAIRARLAADGGLASLFATCLRCHNCMTACPICYCKTCLFRTAAFDHSPEHYLNLAQRKGATRMLGDTLLFQLTRMNHMSASCVSCGQCTSACPAGIPVGAIFSAVGAQVQAEFAYRPGHDAQEPLPLITFQANEWTEIGEAR